MNTSTDIQMVNQCEPSTELASESARSAKTFVPRADIYETENEIIVHADMPGADENSVDITVEKNILSINARVDFQPPSGHALTYAEYPVGDYARKFALANEIDRDGITASMKHGVLRLVLPKSSAAKTKKITVKAE